MVWQRQAVLTIEHCRDATAVFAPFAHKLATGITVHNKIFFLVRSLNASRIISGSSHLLLLLPVSIVSINHYDTVISLFSSNGQYLTSCCRSS